MDIKNLDIIPRNGLDKCMVGCVVTFSHLADQLLRKEIKKRIKLLGGKYEPGLTKTVTHLITEDWTSAKSIYARANKRPIVMRPTWIDAVFEQSEDQILPATHPSFHQFKLPIFYGFTFCLTQVQPEQRKSIKQKIERNGGNYSGNFDPSVVTHLVLLAPRGQKYNHSLKYDKVKKVNALWFVDSLTQGFPLPEENYPPKDVSQNSEANENFHNFSMSKIANEEYHIQCLQMSQERKKSQETPRSSNHLEGIKERSSDNILIIDEKRSTLNESCLNKSELIETEGNNSLPLKGFNFYTSTLIGGQLEKIHDLIIKQGGSITSSIDVETTHLVISGRGRETSEEYIKAKKLGIKIVDINWLYRFSPPEVKNKRKSGDSFPNMADFLASKKTKSNLFNNCKNLSNKRLDRHDRSTIKNLEKADIFENALKNLGQDKIESSELLEEPRKSTTKLSPQTKLKLKKTTLSQASDNIAESLPVIWEGSLN